MLRRSRIASLVVLFLTCPAWGTADDGAPEIIVGPKANAVWQRLVQSQGNLDVLTHAKLIVKVPVVPSGNGVSDLVAGFASLAWFREDQFFAPDARSMLAGPIVHRTLEKQLAGTNDSNRFIVEDGILKELKMEYLDDLIKNQAKPPKASKRQVFVRTIQEYFERVQNENGVERLKEAVKVFMKSRDLSVVVAVEDASWDRCREAVNRDSPFLCLVGERDKPQVLVCVGYAEANTKRYLVVLNPKGAQLQKQPLADILNDVDRAFEGDAVVETIRAASGDVVSSDFYTTQPLSPPPPGLAVIAVHSAPVSCLFFHKWQQDEKAMQDRIERLFNRNNTTK